MNRLSVTLLAFLLVAANIVSAQSLATVQVQTLNAKQVAQLDLTGKWSGKRNQYSWDRKTFIESFQYEFDLKQEGNIITGTSTIINSKGEYADMKLEGVIIGNKLHFAETEVKSAIRPEGKLWCFKSGELNITFDGNNIKLTGSTPSYMEGYNYPCSGGVTDITKVDNSNIDLSALTATSTTTSTGTSPNISINVYPNPFVQNANINYSIPTDSKVQVEVYDISGKLVNALFTGAQKAGIYHLNFASKTDASMSGVFVVKFTINDEVYSRQLVQLQ